MRGFRPEIQVSWLGIEVRNLFSTTKVVCWRNSEFSQETGKTDWFFQIKTSLFKQFILVVYNQ
jgi:hypothetical protein